MAEDDIYGSKAKYERFKSDLALWLSSSYHGGPRGGAKYYCKNPSNARYVEKLFSVFEGRDTSYIRRNRVLQSMRLLCHLIEKDLADCARDDIDAAIGTAHAIYRTARSKQTFVSDLKFIFRVALPELDDKGRPDE